MVPLAATDRAEAGGYDPLEGFLHLGPKLAAGEPGFPLLLARTGREGPWDLLAVDVDGDGTAERVTGKTGRFSLTLMVEHLEGTRILREPYAVEIEVSPPGGTGIGESGGPEASGEIRVTGLSYRSADLSVAGASLTILLADGNSDGVFGAEDLWTIARDAGLLAHPFTSETAREVGDFAWAAGRAWMLRLEGTAGRRGFLVAHHPDVTQEEDGRRRKTYAADRAAPRAESPLICLGGLKMLDPDGPGAPVGPIRAGAAKEALPEGGPDAEGRERASLEAEVGHEEGKVSSGPTQERISSRRAVLLYFNAPGCAQCEDMERLAFPSREVAEAARKTACWRVDADSRPDLLDTYRVGGVPAGILLDGEGRELGRFEGYAGVGELAALLRRAPS